MNRTQLTLEPHNYDAMMILCGNLDENINAIESYFNVVIRHRSADFEIASDSSVNNTQSKISIKSCYAEILAGNDEFDITQITSVCNVTAREETARKQQVQEKLNEYEIKLRSKKLKARTKNCRCL